MNILILKAISWKGGISDMSIVGIFRNFKYLLRYKDKLGTCLLCFVSHLGVCFKSFKIEHVPTRWLSGFLIIQTFLNDLCIDLHMERVLNGFNGYTTL